MSSSFTSAVAEPALFYQPVHARNVNLVRKLIEVVMPVSYSDDFYAKLLETPPEFTKMAYYHDIFVGVVACRLEPFPEGGPTAKRLYLMVLGVLAPYRSRGIGSALLREVLSALDKGKGGDVKEAYLHVWEKNAETIPFYERLGFVRGERVENYYTQRLESPHAVVLRRATVPAVGGDAGVVTVPTAAKAAAV